MHTTDGLTHPQCQLPFSDPNKLTTCKHEFCKACITAWISQQSSRLEAPSCPLDRTRIIGGLNALLPSVTTRERVDELAVLCSLGCEWTGKRAEWRDHLVYRCIEVEVGGERRGGPAPSPEEEMAILRAEIERVCSLV